MIAGYCTDPTLLGYEIALSPGRDKSIFSFGALSADQILSRVTDPAKLTFHNLVEITDPAALLRSKANIIVLHKYIMALKIIPKSIEATSTHDALKVYYRSVELLKVRFQDAFGPPIYEDGQIICFGIKQPKPGEKSPAR